MWSAIGGGGYNICNPLGMINHIKKSPWFVDRDVYTTWDTGYMRFMPYCQNPRCTQRPFWSLQYIKAWGKSEQYPRAWQSFILYISVIVCDSLPGWWQLVSDVDYTTHSCLLRLPLFRNPFDITQKLSLSSMFLKKFMLMISNLVGKLNATGGMLFSKEETGLNLVVWS